MDRDGKPTRRHPTFTPNKALVTMNDLVDRIIEINFPLKFRGLNYIKPIPPDWRFDTHGLRFTFFVGGWAVNESVVCQWWRMENDKRQNKLPQRSLQGTHARHKRNTNTMAQSIGITGGTVRPTRATIYCQARCI